jgi:hypothetical protein
MTRTKLFVRLSVLIGVSLLTSAGSASAPQADCVAASVP